MNSVALSGSTDAATATAYSISQQLVTSAWNVLFAVALVSWVFGWSGGKALVLLGLPRDDRRGQCGGGALRGRLGHPCACRRPLRGLQGLQPFERAFDEVALRGEASRPAIFYFQWRWSRTEEDDVG